LIDEDPMMNDQHQYRYMTVDDMKSLGDDSLKIDVTRDEKTDVANDSASKFCLDLFVFVLMYLSVQKSYLAFIKIFFCKFTMAIIFTFISYTVFS